MAIYQYYIAAAAVFDFRNFKFLMVGTVNSVELRYRRAKFCGSGNRSNRNRDIAIFSIF